MKASKVTIQRYSGGPEHGFFLRQGVIRRAALVLMEDEEYKRLPKDQKPYYTSLAGIAMCAAYEGIETGFDGATVESCDGFSTEWAMEVEEAGIPGGTEENPTATPGETS